MLKKESDILGFFAKEPWRRFTFTELRLISKKRSRSYLDLVLKRFVKEDVIKREQVGKLYVYSLDITSPKARSFAGFVLERNAWTRKHIPYGGIEKIICDMPTKNFVLIITGSYAKGKQTEKSDIDVVILINDAAETKKVYSQLTHICEMNIPQIHLYVFKNNEFIEMLLNKEANYGKEIVLNNIILCGGQTYLQLIWEAMSHGFTGKFTY